MTVLLDDYRELDGTYDKLVSIEMIEAVGWKDFGTFFERCSSLLRPDGVMALQAITIDDRLYDVEKAQRSFMNSLIFPNGCLPSVEVIARNVARRSDLRMVDLEDITPHYAETLRRWRANVEAHAPTARRAGLRRALPAALAAVPVLLRGGLHRAPHRQRPDRARQAALARPPGHRRGARAAVRRLGGARVKARRGRASSGSRVAYGAALLVAPAEGHQDVARPGGRPDARSRCAASARARSRCTARRSPPRCAARRWRRGWPRQHRRRPERHRRDLRGPRAGCPTARRRRPPPSRAARPRSPPRCSPLRDRPRPRRERPAARAARTPSAPTAACGTPCSSASRPSARCSRVDMPGFGDVAALIGGAPVTPPTSPRRSRGRCARPRPSARRRQLARRLGRAGAGARRPRALGDGDRARRAVAASR